MNFDHVIKVPKKISPCPIAEAVVELRFSSKLPREALVGVVYEKLKDRYPDYSSLPITQLPTDFIENQPNLKYAPSSQLKNKDFIFQIGPRCFSIICPKEYKGWRLYSEEINWIFDQLMSLNVIETPERLGIRYVNFFKELNIFEKINADLSLSGNSLIKNMNTLRTEFDLFNNHCVYQINNNSLLEGKDTGSSIDIDLIISQDLNINDYKAIINNSHDLQKRLFFGVLAKDFLETLNPEYE